MKLHYSPAGSTTSLIHITDTNWEHRYDPTDDDDPGTPLLGMCGNGVKWATPKEGELEDVTCFRCLQAAQRKGMFKARMEAFNEAARELIHGRPPE